MNRFVALATLFWLAWVLGNAMAFGFGFRTARPISLDVSSNLGVLMGAASFVLVLGAVPTLIHLPLLAHFGLRSVPKPAPPNAGHDWVHAAALAGLIAGAAVLGLIALLGLGMFYSGFLTATVLLVAARELLQRLWRRGALQSAPPSVPWRRPWVLISTLAVVGFASVAGQPWLLGDTCRTCGHVPMLVIGGLVGAVTGSVLLIGSWSSPRDAV